MKVSELKSDNIVIEWLRNSRASKNTRETYLIGLQFYTEFTNKSPTELIDEAEFEIGEGFKRKKQKMYGYVTDFKLWLRCKGNTKLREE